MCPIHTSKWRKDMPVSMTRDMFEEDGLSYAEPRRRHENSPRGRAETLIFADMQVPPTDMKALLGDLAGRERGHALGEVGKRRG